MKRVALAILLAGGTAHAGGLARPNAGSPRSAGLSGAFTAVADDAYCLHANPAGCATAPLEVLASLELVYAPRTYIPADGEQHAGEPQDSAAVAPAPVIGALFRPAGSKLTFGIGAWNTYGGQLHWDELPADEDGGFTAQPAQIVSTRELVFELVGGVGYALDDRVSIGAALRLGVGLFAVEAINKPVDADLSGTGVGIGASAGILIRATDALTLGLAWRSDLDVTTTGSGTLDVAGTLMRRDLEHVQQWPQSASIALAYHLAETTLVTAQLDWTQWSRMEALDVHFPSESSLDTNTHYELDWDDVLTARLGGQVGIHDRAVVRAGVLYDGNAVPDRTIERQYLDAVKYGASLGTSIGLTPRATLDVTADWVGGPARTVEVSEEPTWEVRGNVAPGEHSGQVYTLATGVRIAL